MQPVRTKRSNFVYRGPTPDIGDAWVERRPADQVVYMEWQLDEDERQLIANGALVRLGIYHFEPIPPVSLGVIGAASEVITAEEPPATTAEVVEQLGGDERYAARGDRPPRPPAPPRDREMG